LIPDLPALPFSSALSFNASKNMSDFDGEIAAPPHKKTNAQRKSINFVGSLC
jgi:hypothetical protein